MIRSTCHLVATVTFLALAGCNPTKPSSPARLLSVRLVPDTDTLKVGQLQQFGLSETWSPGARPPTVSPHFFDDNADVASVDLSGNVTGKTPGHVTLTGCVGDICDSRLLTVTP